MATDPELADELCAFLNRRFHIAVRVRTVRGGIGYRVYQVSKPKNRHLVDVRAAAERLAAAGEHDYADSFIYLLEGVGERIEQRGIESIDLLRAVEEDARHPAFTYELKHAFIL